MAVEGEIVDRPKELALFDASAKMLEEAKAKNANLVFDYEDLQGNKDARSWVAVLRKLKSPINAAHKEAKAAVLRKGRLIDAEKNKYMTVLESMIDFHDKPIKEIAEREAARIAEVERIAKEKEEAAQEKARLELEAREKAAADKEAENRRRQEELDRKEREAQIKADAERKAKDDAENERQRAEERAAKAASDAENRRLADVQRAKDEAAAEAAEKERVLQVKASKKAHDKEVAERDEQERVADVKHREATQEDIKQDFMRVLLCEEDVADDIVAALVDGISHVTIQY